MKVQVIKVNSLEEAFAQLAALGCVNCNCGERVFASAPAVAEKTEPTVDLNYFLQSLAEKKGWRPERMAGWLNGIAELSPIAAFNIVVREIAIYLDQKYEDHIENSEKIFVISSLDGRIHEVCKAHVKNYRNFAAFRTIEDARFACNILRGQLKGMFKKNAKRK